MVKVKNADKVFAMKILNKWEMLKRAEVSNNNNNMSTFVQLRPKPELSIYSLHFYFKDTF